MTEQNQRDESERVVVRDKRKIDPLTGEARKPEAERPAEAHVPSVEPAVEAGEHPFVDATLLDERTRDLQRVQAEYANYRKRAERERLAAGELAVGRVFGELLPVLDDLDRARQHGDLTGALKAVADKIEGVAAKFGLVAFGEVGDPFDPVVHEAVLHGEGDDVGVPTCTTVMRQGYKHGERLLRPAMVGVTDPVAGAAAEVVAEPEAAAPAPVEQPAAADEPADGNE